MYRWVMGDRSDWGRWIGDGVYALRVTRLVELWSLGCVDCGVEKEAVDWSVLGG